MSLYIYCPKSNRGTLSQFIEFTGTIDSVITVKELMDGFDDLISDRDEMIYRLHKWFGLGEIDCDCCNAIHRKHNMQSHRPLLAMWFIRVVQ